jgi:hypothetical protein
MGCRVGAVQLGLGCRAETDRRALAIARSRRCAAGRRRPRSRRTLLGRTAPSRNPVTTALAVGVPAGGPTSASGRCRGSVPVELYARRSSASRASSASSPTGSTSCHRRSRTLITRSGLHHCGGAWRSGAGGDREDPCRRAADRARSRQAPIRGDARSRAGVALTAPGPLAGGRRTARCWCDCGSYRAERYELIGAAGLEPATFGPPDRRANQAAPRPVVGHGRSQP